MSVTVTEAQIEQAANLLRSRLPDNRPSHDITHAIRVHNLAVRLAKSYPPSFSLNLNLIRLCALLHDLFDHKFVSDTRDAMQHFEQTLKNDLTMPAGSAERVVFICQNISFSKQRKKELAKSERCLEMDIVQDADRLEAIGAVGIARCFAFAGERGDSLQSARKHFDDKLLKLEGLLRTDPGRELARKRHQRMVDFVASFDEETEYAADHVDVQS